MLQLYALVMGRMSTLLDELTELQSQSLDVDINLLDKRIDQMMPELGSCCLLQVRTLVTEPEPQTLCTGTRLKQS